MASMNLPEYPKSDLIEPDVAKALFEKHCAILIVEGLPRGSEFGIDMVVHRTGEMFKGIKLIPPGIHFIYASAMDAKNHQLGPRSGFFHNFRVKEMLIKKWLVSEEDFDDSYRPSEDHIERYKSNIRDLDRYLGPYSFSTYSIYLNLTSELTTDVIDALVPDCKKLRSVPYLTRRDPAESKPSRLRSSYKTAEDNLLPDLIPHQSSVIHFTDLAESYIDSKQPLEQSLITQYHLDSTMRLEQAFSDDSARDQLLAEIQFSFLVFLLCHIYSCFEHWKKLLELICKANSGLRKFHQFYGKFIKIVHHQMNQVPEDLFADIVDSNNLIRSLFDDLFKNIQDHFQDEFNDLTECCATFKKFLEDKFNWQFGLEPEDEQPVVVET